MAAHSARGDLDQDLAYRAAQLYYESGMLQVDVARELGISRPAVSRLLATARQTGIVRISVIDPAATGDTALAAELAAVLGIDRVRLAPGTHLQASEHAVVSATADALDDAGLTANSVVLASSGRTVNHLSRQRFEALDGCTVLPAVGGSAEPDVWHQTNEIVRGFGTHSGARPVLLFAEARPSPGLFAAMQSDPGFQQIRDLWDRADASLLGIGPPTSTRHSISAHIPLDAPELAQAVGDICLHFYDLAGSVLTYEGSDRTVQASIESLRRVPHSIAVAIGTHKALSILAGSRLGVFRTLVTDEATARAVLAAAGREPAGPAD